MPAALEWLVAVDLVRPHPPQTTGVAKPEPKIEPGGQIAEGLHGQYGYVPGLRPVKDFFGSGAKGQRLPLLGPADGESAGPSRWSAEAVRQGGPREQIKPAAWLAVHAV